MNLGVMTNNWKDFRPLRGRGGGGGGELPGCPDHLNIFSSILLVMISDICKMLADIGEMRWTKKDTFDGDAKDSPTCNKNSWWEYF